MEFKLISGKPTEEIGGEVSVDMLAETFKFPENYSLQEIYVLKEMHSMRPDIISSEFYGTADYTDGILKFNGVSNPFAVSEGDVFIIPSRSSIEQSYRSPITAQASDILANSFRDPGKKRLDGLGLPPTYVPPNESYGPYRDGNLIVLK